jgi:hypothetical protein
MRRFTIAALLALALVLGVVGYAIGQVVPPADGDDERITACVGGTNLNVPPAQRSWVWLNENLAEQCPTGYTRVDWLNS